MKPVANVGGLDRVLRTGVGLALVLWAATGGPLLAWLGIWLLINAVTGWCPAYQSMGRATARTPAGNPGAHDVTRGDGDHDRNS